MTPTRRRAECPVCRGVFHVRLDGLLRRHPTTVSRYVEPELFAEPCEGSYGDCTSEETTT